jgi:hypothetical protein
MAFLARQSGGKLSMPSLQPYDTPTLLVGVAGRGLL